MTIEKAKSFHPDSQFPEILKCVAEIHNIYLTDKEVENVKVIITACGIADDIVDTCNSPEERRRISEEALLFLENKREYLSPTGNIIQPAYEESMKYLRDFVSQQTTESREIFISCLRIWNSLSEKRRTENNIDKSIKLRKADLGFTSVIYLAGISEPNRSNPKFRHFVRDVKRMVRIAGMLDDGFDLKRDFRDGVIPIRPNFKNRIKIMGNGIMMGTAVIKDLFNFDLMVKSSQIMAREFKRRGEDNLDQYILG